MWLYAATCICKHCPEQSVKVYANALAFQFWGSGFGFRVHEFKNMRTLHMHTWKLVPHAHAHLGAVAFCTCTLGREFPSTVLSAVATLLKQERYSCKNLAIHRQRFSHICSAYALSNTWPRQAGGDKCRMDVLNAHHCLQPMPLGINCSLFQNILHTVPRMQQSLLVHGHWP